MPIHDLSTTFFALADATRRDILSRLATGDATVNELAAPYEMSLAAVSKHLKVLENAGLISRGREAQWRPCHLEGKPLREVAEWAMGYERFWTRNMDSLGAYLEKLQRPSAARSKNKHENKNNESKNQKKRNGK